jgi:hypothetical protein
MKQAIQHHQDFKPESTLRNIFHYNTRSNNMRIFTTSSEIYTFLHNSFDFKTINRVGTTAQRLSQHCSLHTARVPPPQLSQVRVCQCNCNHIAQSFNGQRPTDKLTCICYLDTSSANYGHPPPCHNSDSSKCLTWNRRDHEISCLPQQSNHQSVTLPWGMCQSPAQNRTDYNTHKYNVVREVSNR